MACRIESAAGQLRGTNWQTLTNLTLTNGTLAMTIDTLFVGNTWNNTAAKFAPGSGTVELDSGGTRTLTPNSQAFHKLRLKKSGGGQITLGANTTVNVQSGQTVVIGGLI